MYSKEIIKVLKEYLEKKDWIYIADDERGKLFLGCDCKKPMEAVSLEINVGEDDFVVYGYPVISVDEKTGKPNMLELPKVESEGTREVTFQLMEFFFRINYEMTYGSFELNIKTGVIRSQCQEHFDGGIRLTEDVITKCIITPIILIGEFGKGIMMIMESHKTAEEAEELCMDAFRTVGKRMKRGGLHE